MIVLIIDTADNKEIKVELRVGNKKYIARRKVDYRRAQIVLPLIDKILREKNIKLQGLSKIEVNTKQGSFTGVRVGLSVAKALGFALGIPIKKA